jgi:hypothetical protein
VLPIVNALQLKKRCLAFGRTVTGVVVAVVVAEDVTVLVGVED